MVSFATLGAVLNAQAGELPEQERDGRVWSFAADPGELDGLSQLGDESDDLPRPVLLAGDADADGDGVPDLAIASPGTDEVRVHSGKTGALLSTLANPSPGLTFGREIAFAGDTNGDGRSEILIGFGAELGGALSTGGGAEGVSDRGVQLFALEGGDALHTLDEIDDALAFCGLGDVNGDGFSDYAVARHDSPMGMRSVEVRSGATSAVIRTHSQLIDDNAFLDFGARVAGVGDLNADGVPDLAVSAPGAELAIDEGGALPLAGRVLVYSGANGSELLDIAGPAGGARFGLALRAAGDLNGDGTRDLVAFSQSENPFELLTGSVHAVSGSDGSELFQVQSSLATSGSDAAGNMLGSGRLVDACGAGDVNGDGFDDVVAAVMLDAGLDAPALRVFSGVDGSLLRGLALPDGEGVVLVSPAGDLNGDGHAELAVTTRGAGGAAGLAQVVFGGDPWFGTLGDRVQHITSPDASDAFFFAAVKGTRLKAALKRLKQGTLLPALDVIGPLPFTDSLIGEQPLLAANGKSVKLPKNFTLPDTGVYRIEVSAGDGNAGAYQLKTSGGKPKVSGVIDAGGPDDEPPVVLPGQKVIGTVEAGEVTSTVVPAVAGSEITITVKRGKGSALNPEFGLLFQGVTDLIFIFPEGTAINPKTARVKKFTLPETGLYRIEVSGANNSAGTFTLRTKQKPPKGKTKSKLPTPLNQTPQ
ncbi:MAG: hypothetical protein DHS20C15_32970 [Planctomycetota bacterium]|nr:MAG: hypothetical protein DHS20C15_32970 [Planctomycetota bacterium]